MAKRATRAQVARETLQILEAGHYHSPAEQTVHIEAELESACSRSLLYRPDDFNAVVRRRDELLRERTDRPAIAFEVVNETTLHAAQRLLTGDVVTGVLALNFASARNPGGGFLQGSQAQEESLARASGLYACVTRLFEMYEANRRCPSCLYTDHLIYSPDVPVFRDDDDHLLERPYLLSFLTSPAVNVGAIRKNEPSNLADVEPVMFARMEKFLSVAVVHGHEVLVLGAWGCGVFGNNPRDVATWFAQHLTGEGIFRTAFRKVVFAVLDRGQERSTIQPFEEQFGGRP